MMDWTDRHCRYFLRLLTPSAMLCTEMVTAAAIHHGDYETILTYDEAEHPVALQVGGSDPELMAEAAQRGAEFGYDEININVGCPITVKTRVGIDDQDSYEFLHRFVDIVRAAGCHRFIVHARIAILEGLSPKENRTVPPLKYERVYRLKRQFPDLDIILNGGVTSVEQVDEILAHVDGVMIGRQAYHDPYLLARIESHFDAEWVPPSRHTVIERMIPYIERELAAGERLGRITRHMLGLFTGEPGARAWRRHLSENAFRDGAASEVLVDALQKMPVAA
jgi:tRNA-dihydrouridine synthase A